MTISKPLTALLVFLLGPLFVSQVDSLAQQQPSPVRVVLVGDSTVKNGRGQGDDGLWGWGQVLQAHFDPTRAVVENRALGGRSSRTYLTEGLWEKSLARLRPGDFVLIQFGHNDGGKMFEGDRPRASIKGNGEETRSGVVEATEREETVHSYSWYLRHYIAEAKKHGATPIVCSLVPRDRWVDGKVIRSDRDYALWARQAAEDGGAAFIDLNEIVAARYETLGESYVGKELFTETDWTHTTRAGALVNAQCVVEGIRQLEDCQLKDHLLPATNKTLMRFDFGDPETEVEYVSVGPRTYYQASTGFGLEVEADTEVIQHPTAAWRRGRDGLQSDRPFGFSVNLPEGNYRVRVGCSESTVIKAELRRLMICGGGWQQGEVEFAVNLRQPKLEGGKTVRLKERERQTESRAWDNRLSLEFNGKQPQVYYLEIEPAEDLPTVFLAGDSTVADQPQEPWNSWGQMLPVFFGPGLVIANHAESGESIRSSLGAGRFQKIYQSMKPGDYLLVQFGHNDMKDRSPNALAVYREGLENIVRETRMRQGHPVLVTSVERKNGVRSLTLGDYPETVREVAKAMKVPLVDLNQRSLALYRQLGTHLDEAFQDGTHHNAYGSFLLARQVVQQIVELKLPIQKHLRECWSTEDWETYVPAANFRVPLSPGVAAAKPDGS